MSRFTFLKECSGKITENRLEGNRVDKNVGRSFDGFGSSAYQR